jgi:hypothetical protein
VVSGFRGREVSKVWDFLKSKLSGVLNWKWKLAKLVLIVANTPHIARVANT